MKKLIQILLILGFIISGCSQLEESPTEPELISNPVSTSKNSSAFQGILETVSVYSELEIIGAVGGQITILNELMDSTGRIISVYADLIVPPGAFDGIKTISMKVDLKSASIDFNPSMHFTSNLNFNCWLSNLPLAELGLQKSDTVLFAYIDSLGNKSPILSKNISMNWNKGRLHVNGAKIEHFSRYGFIRKNSNRDMFGLQIAQ